ncbi:hypothetical protein BROUX41_006350 [Berkeleyomyces rouxiae]|uniref:uncharacterized protein n=1 Tax=Berkeleyomyces rouxiae TaxID=2035830 RepID=UPI003B7EE61B
MDSIQYYCFSSCAWLGLQGGTLLVFPRFVLSLLREDYQADTALEVYFARSLGFALIALAVFHVVLSGGVPLTSSLSEAVAVSPYASAIMLISALHHAATASYCYGMYTWANQSAFAFGLLVSAFLSVVGLGCFMFAGDTSTVSKNLHLDKATSSFPFKNAEAYHEKKSRIRKNM